MTALALTVGCEFEFESTQAVAAVMQVAPSPQPGVRILLQEPLAPAWQRVHDGLAAAGDDWQEHLQLNPLPG